MRTVYIAGKVTGENRKHCEAKFEHAETYIRTKGCEPVNPTKLVNEDTEWTKAMTICKAELKKCNAIFLLPDWHESAGAKEELMIALENDMIIINGFTL